MSVYMIILIVVPLIWIVFEVSLVIRDRSRGMGSVTKDKGSRNFNFIAITMGILLAAALNNVAGFIFPHGKSPAVFILGISAMLLGMVLRYWSVATLGKAFRTTIETDQNQQIIQSGPYKLIRHPSYTGWLLICLGYGVAVQNWLSVAAAFLLPLAALLYRIREEEAVLVSSFGSTYQEYQKHTHRLIPWVW